MRVLMELWMLPTMQLVLSPVESSLGAFSVLSTFWLSDIRMPFRATVITSFFFLHKKKPSWNRGGIARGIKQETAHPQRGSAKRQYHTAVSPSSNELFFCASWTTSITENRFGTLHHQIKPPRGNLHHFQVHLEPLSLTSMASSRSFPCLETDSPQSGTDLVIADHHEIKDFLGVKLN